MFRRIFGPTHEAAADRTEQALVEGAAGETATVRRIVARLEALPPDRARLAASAAYILARAAHADSDISAEETALMERELQDHGLVDEATAVIVIQMAKLQARTVGDTEDYVVTREFKALATPEQRVDILRASFAIGAENGTISAEEAAVLNQIARELDIEQPVVNQVRAEYHDLLSSVQAVRRIAHGQGRP
ncbi:MAG TPA: TerB family tellurite resistance protein [Clostridia bacterium]|nr:TerB family tellurite resistance protein [Clostridia bacterium]